MNFVLLSWVCVLFIDASTGLNHGRNAKPGEFPYIMRIIVSVGDDEHDDLDHSLRKYEAGEDALNGTDLDHKIATVSTGVLIAPTRVLTTCDSVGFFTGETITLYNLSRVSIMGGSVLNRGGKFKSPNSSSAHPYCYSLLVSKVVLFNYGIYTISAPFTDALVRPIKHFVNSKRDLEYQLRHMWEGRINIQCVTAGWGNPRKQFEGVGKPDRFERFSKVLQTTTVEIVTYPVCYKSTCSYFNDCLMSIWEYGFVCAKAPRGGPCIEDDGAPLVCSGQLFAIHANPLACEDDGLPRHFLRIDLAYDYIFGVKDCSHYHVSNEFYVMVAFLVTLWRHQKT